MLTLTSSINVYTMERHAKYGYENSIYAMKYLDGTKQQVYLSKRRWYLCKLEVHYVLINSIFL